MKNVQPNYASPKNPAKPSTGFQPMSLDALLAESMPMKATLKPDGMFDLDDLLAESMVAKRNGDAVKKARTTLAMGNMHPDAKEKLQAVVRAHELRVDWQNVAAVAVFNRQYCNECELVHIHFEGFFQRQKHRTSKVERWVKSVREQMLAELPKEVKYEEAIVDSCEECCGLAGYPIEE